MKVSIAFVFILTLSLASASFGYDNPSLPRLSSLAVPTSSAGILPGSCPAGQVVQNTTSGGVQCVSVSAGGGGFTTDQNTELNITGRPRFTNVTINNTLTLNRLTSGGSAGIIYNHGNGIVIDGNASLNDVILRVGGNTPYILISGTPTDSFGRMLEIQQTGYALNSGSTKYMVSFSARGSTGGSVGMRAAQYDVRYTGTGAQTGTLMAVGGQVYHTGTGTTAYSYPMFFQMFLDSNTTATEFTGAYISGEVSANRNGTIGIYRGFYDRGLNVRAGNNTNAYSFYSTTHTNTTGTIRNAYGLYLEKQSNGVTNNYQIYSAGGDVMLAGNGNITVSGMSGTGNAFACVDSNGKLYRSASACA